MTQGDALGQNQLVQATSLQNKGFVKKNKDHKTFRYIMLDGTGTSIFTHYSHGSSGRDVNDGVLGAMARQCRISSKQFRQLVECPLKRDAYEELLRESGAF